MPFYKEINFFNHFSFIFAYSTIPNHKLLPQTKAQTAINRIFIKLCNFFLLMRGSSGSLKFEKKESLNNSSF
ncbi:MAG: hypothetical protein A3F40_04860 [Chlamydiae bacterium RIFCSPHIGHO2_12_FULL_27_8]|nr:MAG: hypothetical protein A3F40_04860 [Chlamydiae bacterium RIFCSPHIGHO2_12_FULL_27_8]